MKFFKKLLVYGTIFATIFLFPLCTYAENHVMKIAFVGDPNIETAIIGKVFDSSKIFREDHPYVCGIRTIKPDDFVLYKFKDPGLNKDQLESKVLSDCDIVFMIGDFAPGKSNLDSMLKKDFSKVRGISGGKKIILIAVNADCLSSSDLKKLMIHVIFMVKIILII